jgi:hypothetical protein
MVVVGSPDEMPSLEVSRAALDGWVGPWLLRGDVCGRMVVLGATVVVVGATVVVGAAAVVDGAAGMVVVGATVVVEAGGGCWPEVGHDVKSACLLRQNSFVADAGAPHVPTTPAITARSVSVRAHRILLCTIGWHRIPQPISVNVTRHSSGSDRGNAEK